MTEAEGCSGRISAALSLAPAKGGPGGQPVLQRQEMVWDGQRLWAATAPAAEQRLGMRPVDSQAGRTWPAGMWEGKTLSKLALGVFLHTYQSDCVTLRRSLS